MPKYFVIADTHFSHQKIIEYCNRPFKSLWEMDHNLIKLWNESVSNKDYVFMLGDFAFGKDAVKEITPMLNGRKILVKGNRQSPHA